MPNWDNSNIILANQAGAYMGRGIESGVANLTRGIERGQDMLAQQKERERQEKERDRKMAEEVKRYAGIAKAAGMPPGAVEAMSLGELQGAVEGLAVQMTQQKFEREEKQRQAEAERQARNDSALTAAIAPRGGPGAMRQPTIDEIAMSYLQQGGRDQDMVGQAFNLMQRSQAAQAAGEANGRIGEVMDIRGQPFVRTNSGQITPLEMPKDAEQYFDTPEVKTVDGVQFSRSGPNKDWRPLPRATGGNELNPMVVGSLEEQSAQLQNELVEHQLAMSKGDKRYGLGNARSRATRIQEIETRLRSLQATLRAGGAASTAAPASAAPADALDGLNW